MILKFLFILILINIIKCDIQTKRNTALGTAINNTFNFFEKLNYVSKNLNNNITVINKKVTEYTTNVTKKMFTHHKRDLYKNSKEGINIFNGFQDFNKLNFDGVQDINFFPLQYGFKTIWFAVVLDISKVSLYEINNEIFDDVGSYSLINGTEMIVNSYTYEALLIIQNQNGSVVVLSFTKVLDKYYLQPIQNFELNDVIHLTIWNGMNKLYLSTISHSNISIFTWFGNYFDLMQVININTKKLIPFQSKGFMYLAVTGSNTLIFKYFLKFNKFLLIQRLPSSQDVSFFQLREGHFMEHFLTLSTESSTIIYKEINDHFVPFQQISSGKFIVPIILSKTIVLLTLHKDIIVIYQYDGWKFIELSTKLFEISQFRQVILCEKELLLVKNKNDKWTLKQPLWIKKTSYKGLQEEIRIWNIYVKSKVQRIIKEILNLKNSINIIKGHIRQFYVHNINRHNSQKLKNVSKQYKKLISKFQAQKIVISSKWHSKNLTVTSLHAKKIQVKCKNKCKVNRLNVEGNTNLLFKFSIPKDINQVFSFKELNAKKIKNWKCPLLNFIIEDIIVHKSINEISLRYLQENALKVTGNQKITGKHIFVNVNAINVFMPLNIATNLTNQELIIKEMKVKHLNLTAGGILLPLNGPFSTVTGLIKIPKLKVKGGVHLQAKISGKWRRRSSPIIDISEFIVLNGDCSLKNVKIENLRCTDLIAKNTGSVKNTLSNAISLNDAIPVPLIFSSEKVKWSNTTLYGLQNWITANSQNINIILGKKHILQNVKITKFSYNNLKFPRYDLFFKDSKLCASSIIASEIKTSLLTVDIITIKDLISLRLFGNLGKRYFINNTTVLFNPILFEIQYYYNVTAKNIFTMQINNLNLTELERLMNLWIESNIFNVSIETTDLIINTLQLPTRFNIELHKAIQNIILERNAHVYNINNINYIDFFTNTIKLKDMISLQNITFRNGFSTNHIFASYVPFNLINIRKNNNFHKKKIFENIEVNAIDLPYSFKISQNDTLVNVVVKGFASFPLEPKIKNVNDINLQKLSSEIWLAINTTILYGKSLYFKDAIIEGNFTLNNIINTLNPEVWKNISTYVLSKTKLQEIIFHASLNNVEVPILMGSNASTIISTSSDFNDMFENSLLKKKIQKVRAKWTFNQLKILGNLHAKHTINNLNFENDIMRYNSKENIVTGRKTVMVLNAENLNGYGFNKWVANALLETKKDITIKGRTKFSTAAFNTVKVSGTIMGHTMEETLSKSINQTIYVPKKIQGTINASELIINGFINDVNMTELMDHQLKKDKSIQTIKTDIALQNSLNIYGNLTIEDTYAGVVMKNLNKSYSNITFTTDRMKKFSSVTKAINIALQSRAIYINNLEVVKDTFDTSNKSIVTEKMQCKFTRISSQCNNELVTNFVLQSNTSNFILQKSIILDEEEFIVFVKFDSISIYSFNNVENNLVHLKDLYIANITDAFVETRMRTLWIVLRLTSQTLVLHYQPWEDLQKYVLPISNVFIMNRTPNNQLLILLSYGVWDLEGLASPRHIIEIFLKEKVETFFDTFNYYVKCTLKNNTTLMKARYIRN
ncbi:PREDICTED: uncharacterized protein LOC108553282 [Eufriesea mexicana]|uniref:uncharacterized protein LOC108553282 n=1 Tax=Eufriesea mexicana TaxID=516756 RepID=UPI00083BA90C|nr:PREDICTED: uncharacterized protein LOC108553282 [Eufriesea mexicana]